MPKNVSGTITTIRTEMVVSSAAKPLLSRVIVSAFLWNGAKTVAKTMAKIRAYRNGLKIKKARIKIPMRRVSKK